MEAEDMMNVFERVGEALCRSLTKAASAVQQAVGCVAFAVVLTLSAACAHGQQGVESELIVHEFEDMTEFVDGMANKQIDVMETFVTTHHKALERIESGGVRVAEATNDWVKSPTPEHEAEVTRSICEVAAESSEATKELAGLADKLKPVTEMLRRIIKEKIDEMNGASRNSNALADRYDLQFKEVERAVLEARQLLELKGCFKSGDVPPELEERCQMLAVDYTELSLTRDMYRDLATMIDQYAAALDAVRGDFATIDRLARMTAYQAASLSRCYGTIGKVQAIKIEMHSIAKAFERTAEVRQGMAQTFRRIGKMRDGLSGLINASRQLPTLGSSKRSQAEESVTNTGLLDFFRNVNSEAK